MKEMQEIIEKEIRKYYNNDKIYLIVQSITNDKFLIQFEIANDLIEFEFEYDIGLNLQENIFILKYEIDGNITNYYKN